MITVCILTKNSAASLGRTLESVRAFPEVVILDNGSTDKTLAIASAYPNVKIHQAPFIGFGPLRNKAAELASNDWILALDSDEIVSPSLASEIFSLKLEQAYLIPRHNFYNGKRIRGCGWDPEAVVRLYNRRQTRYSDASVHEALLVPPRQALRLKFPLLHTPYRSISDFLAKMEHYSTLFAQQYAGKKKSSFAKALGHGAFAFFKSYLLKRGWLCGKEGFIISFYNGSTAFYKYLKLAEADKNLSH